MNFDNMNNDFNNYSFEGTRRIIADVQSFRTMGICCG